MKEIALAMNLFGNTEISEIERNGKYVLNLPTGNVELTTEDVDIITEDMPGWLVANEGTLTVALDITVSDALLREGVARELVNRIQNIRKSNGYEITDKIIIEIENNTETDAAVNEYATYIATQTLAESITVVEKVSGGIAVDFDDYVVNIAVIKA
jgi:isoleucyl-tRNA synthetase